MNSIDEIRMLPKIFDTEITEDYLDQYGHMNVRWYATLWGRGAGGFMASLGLDFRDAVKRERGNWVLRQVIDYNAEVLGGDVVAIHGRMIEHSDKCMHNMYWMINETRQKIASTCEVLVGYADLNERRLTSFPPELVEEFDTKIHGWNALDWEPQTSGAIALTRPKQ
jgi:acyl-CoA thioester hydrolase